MNKNKTVKKLNKNQIEKHTQKTSHEKKKR